MFRFLVITIVIAVASAIGRHYGSAPYGSAAHSYSRGHAYAPAHYGSYSAPSPSYGGYGHGYDQPIPYDFGYEIAGDHGEFKQNRQESGDGKGNVKGSYGYTDAHGIYRQVDYTADAYGYRAQVKTNEPGTDNQNPADVHISAQPAHSYHQQPYGASSYGAPRYGRN